MFYELDQMRLTKQERSTLSILALVFTLALIGYLIF